MNKGTRRRLLLLSNSRNYEAGYLDHAADAIRDFLGDIRTILFVPYAGVSITWDNYARTVADRFAALGVDLVAVHTQSDPVVAVHEAAAIAVGGGNTFCLLDTMQRNGTLEAIRARAGAGVPYIGWSAGSNVVCPTIRTTNDMPIVEPSGFQALGLVPFQINPHYSEAALPRHGGETRADRIAEFIRVNPQTWVVGLREGSMLRVEDDDVSLLGENAMKVFRSDKEPRELSAADELKFLLGA